MTTIYLIRHAEAEGNLYRRIHGWYDALTTTRGWLQIQALERRFTDIPIDAVWSSPLFRTMATARAIYRPRGLELHTHPGLRELHFGRWEDRTFGDTRYNCPQEMALFGRTDPTWQAPGGETFQMAAARFDAALRSIADHSPNQTIAVFSHGSVIRQFLALVQNIPAEHWSELPFCDNTAVTCLTYDGTAFSVSFEGDNSHLDPDISTLARQSWWRKHAPVPEVNLWYRPLEIQTDRALLAAAGLELTEAQAALERDPNTLVTAMAEGEPVGLLLLAPEQTPLPGSGVIRRLYLAPEHRGEFAALQLVGQAVSFFRGIGRDRLLLTPPPEVDQTIWMENSFRPAPAQAAGLLELYIGYDQ